MLITAHSIQIFLEDLLFSNSPKSSPSPPGPNMLERKRWLILLVFSLISMMNEVIWISLSSVTNILQGYYEVTARQINWISMIFSAMYVTVPVAVYTLNTYGLRVTIVLGAFCNTSASILRLIGYDRNGYVFALVGNALGGMGQCFLIFIPPTLSSIWFGENERGRASSIGMLLNMLGVAVGFLMGSMFVPNSDDYEGVVKHGMFKTLLIQAVACGFLLILSIFVIKANPDSPPSRSRALSIQRQETKKEIRKLSTTTGEVPEHLTRDRSQSTGLFRNWKFLLTSVPFHLLTQAYGLNFGLFVTISTLLNQMTIPHYPGREQLIGIMGCCAVLCGLVGIFSVGVFVDKTHRFKMASVSTITLSGCSLLAFVVVLRFTNNFTAMFCCYCIYGLFSYPYLSTGLEFTAEIMYPVKESILSFVLLFVGCLYAVLFTLGFGYVIDRWGGDTAGCILTALYALALLCVALVKGNLNRLNVDMSKDNVELGNDNATFNKKEPKDNATETPKEVIITKDAVLPPEAINRSNKDNSIERVGDVVVETCDGNS